MLRLDGSRLSFMAKSLKGSIRWCSSGNGRRIGCIARYTCFVLGRTGPWVDFDVRKRIKEAIELLEQCKKLGMK